MKTNKFLNFCFLTLFIFISLNIEAQDKQFPICGSVQVIDASLSKKLNLFSEYKGFLQATLFKNADSIQFLEILYKPDDVIKKEKKTLSNQELAALCMKINDKNDVNIIENIDDDKDGRRLLIGSSMSYALGYYGWAVPTAFGADNANNGKAYIASYMLIGGSSFFVPFLKSRETKISYGMAKGFNAGAGLGIVHGWMLNLLINGTEMDSRFGLGLSVATSVGEGLIGYSIAQNKNYSFGRMGIIGLGGYWGAGMGLGLGYLLNIDDARPVAVAVLGFSGAGIALGNAIAAKQNISEGDLMVINNLGLLGAYLPIALANEFNVSQQDKLIVGGMIVGGCFGLAAGVNKTRHYDYDKYQGYILSAGQNAGALLGLGFAYLVSNENNYNPSIYLWSAGIGALGGFLITDRILRKEMGGKLNKDFGSLKFNLNPLAINTIIGQNSNNSNFNARYPNYLINMSYRFKN